LVGANKASRSTMNPPPSNHRSPPNYRARCLPVARYSAEPPPHDRFVQELVSGHGKRLDGKLLHNACQWTRSGRRHPPKLDPRWEWPTCSLACCTGVIRSLHLLRPPTCRAGECIERSKRHRASNSAIFSRGERQQLATTNGRTAALAGGIPEGGVWPPAFCPWRPGRTEPPLLAGGTMTRFEVPPGAQTQINRGRRRCASVSSRRCGISLLERDAAPTPRCS
jgi:hypothetical protein